MRKKPLNVVKPTDVIEKPKFLVPGKPDIGATEIKAVTEVMKSGWVGTGDVVVQFENEFASFMGAGYAVAVSSCTMGLVMAMRVLNIGEGKEVITTPMTFAATVNAILNVGAKPVFVDVDHSGCLDPDKIRFRVTKESKAIIPVHYTGAACNMGQIMVNADQFGLKVIEDAAHGFGGHYVSKVGDSISMPRKLGTIGDVGVFSFYPTKNITSLEGGMVITKRGDLAERIRILSNQGQVSNAWKRFNNTPSLPYEVVHDGYKGNMTDICAAVGVAQLRRWEELRDKRKKIWDIYEGELGLKEPGHSRHLYTVRVKNRDKFRQKLWEMGIGTGIHYTPLHLEPAYKFLGYKAGDFPIAEKIGEETVTLPLSTVMTEDDAVRVTKAVKTLREESDE